MRAHKQSETTHADEQVADYVEQLAAAHDVSGYTRTSEGVLVYAAYEDGEYDLRTPDG